MAAALRTVSAAPRFWLAVAAAGLVAVPLSWASLAAVAAGLDGAAWRSLLADTQLPRALVLSLLTGLGATALSVALSAWLLSHTFGTARWSGAIRVLAPMLAVPHAAFAIGLAFLLAPSGWILRALSPWATGFSAPPAWATTQDPWGVALIAALVGKEVPFLLWAAATQLQRADAGARWRRELEVARSMGYSSQAAWWRVVWPQLWPRLHAPLLAVMAYSLTAVDMAIVIGPAAPPTAAVLAWQWLLDADVRTNAQGSALAWLLAFVVAVTAAGLSVLRRQLRWRGSWVGGERGRDTMSLTGIAPLAALVSLYVAVLLATAVGSISGVWPFPQFWPQSWSLEGWRSVAASSRTLVTTFGLAITSSLCALAWTLLWLESAPPAWNANLRRLVYLSLVLPPVLWVVGLHRLALAWGLDTRWAGLWLAHTLAALPYVLIALSPAYVGFDARYAHIAASLGRGRLAFLLRVKWPLLRASLWGALAVGFAVSIAQYLPTLFIGGGRFATVTTEAVGLAAGGQRSVLAAYAWLQWLLPVLFFALAAWAGRPRQFASAAT